MKFESSYVQHSFCKIPLQSRIQHCRIPTGHLMLGMFLSFAGRDNLIGKCACILTDESYSQESTDWHKLAFTWFAHMRPSNTDKRARTCMPMPAFDVVYWSSSNVTFHLVSCGNYCMQRNPQDNMEAGTHCSLQAFNISKVSCAWK